MKTLAMFGMCLLCYGNLSGEYPQQIALAISQLPAVNFAASNADWVEPGAPFLEWGQAETLFSLCSRLHRLWGHRRSWQTTEHLFGDRRSGTHHDFPNRLREFASRTGDRYGDATVLAEQRTLLKFYSSFMRADDVADAARTMSGPSVAHLKFRLGLLTSRFRANHPLKACPSCIGLDVRDSDWPTWRISHQYPGVWFYPEHGEPLLTSLVKSTGVERFLWHLPDLKRLVHPTAVAPQLEQGAALLKFARLIDGLLGQSRQAGWLQAEGVQRTCRSRMKEAGLLSPSGRARAKAAAPSYLAHCRVVAVVPELLGLPSDIDMATNEIGRLTRTLRSGTHPLRLLIVIDWLFSDASDFLACHKRCAGGADEDAQAAPSYELIAPPESEQERAEVVRMIEAGHSAASAAKRAGITVRTAMSWAAAVGVATQCRPKVLVGRVRESLVLALSRGEDKRTAAERHGVSVETVTRLLQTEVGLHRIWKDSRFNQARETARSAWLSAQVELRPAGTKLIRAMSPAAYAWLYRNDRDWLAAHTPSSHARPTGLRVSSVRWDERDRELADAVERTAYDLATNDPTRPVLLWRIYQALPELKPKLSSLDRLPLTRRALERALSRRGEQTVSDLFAPPSDFQ